jgi:hypothetical protein
MTSKLAREPPFAMEIICVIISLLRTNLLVTRSGEGYLEKGLALALRDVLEFSPSGSLILSHLL